MNVGGAVSSVAADPPLRRLTARPSSAGGGAAEEGRADASKFCAILVLASLKRKLKRFLDLGHREERNWCQTMLLSYSLSV